MNITITIENPSANVLNALAQALFTDVTTMVQAAPIITPQPDPQDTALRIASVADIDNYLDIGSEVHWKGQKYVFDGAVEKIDDSALEDNHGNANDTGDAKVIFIRRNDTGKLVSLTLRDLQTGRLTLID